MANTTFSGPVTSTNGFVGAVTGNVTGGINGSSGYVITYATTAAAIADATDAVNTSDKQAGTLVLDTTNSRLMVALGSDATSNWAVADGSATVTPS